MKKSLVILDEGIHSILREKGYKYFLITDLKLSENKIYSITVKAEKRIPASSDHSCTGIDDAMIMSFIYKLGLNCDIFIEPYD